MVVIKTRGLMVLMLRQSAKQQCLEWILYTPRQGSEVKGPLLVKIGFLMENIFLVLKAFGVN